MCDWYLLRDNCQGVSLEYELRFDLYMCVSGWRVFLVARGQNIMAKVAAASAGNWLEVSVPEIWKSRLRCVPV